MADIKIRTRSQVIIDMAKLVITIQEEDDLTSGANALQYTNNNHGYIQTAHDIHADACALHANTKISLDCLIAQKVVAMSKDKVFAQHKVLIQTALIDVDPEVFTKRQEEIESKRLADYANGLRVRTLNRSHALATIRHYIGMTE